MQWWSLKAWKRFFPPCFYLSLIKASEQDYKAMSSLNCCTALKDALIKPVSAFSSFRKICAVVAPKQNNREKKKHFSRLSNLCKSLWFFFFFPVDGLCCTSLHVNKQTCKMWLKNLPQTKKVSSEICDLWWWFLNIFFNPKPLNENST